MKKIWHNIPESLPVNKDNQAVYNLLVEGKDGWFGIRFFYNGNFFEHKAADVVPLDKLKRWCHLEDVAALEP